MPKSDAVRNARLSGGRPSSQRELIDARGSVDSRTFDEERRISPVAKDDRDRRAARVDVIDARTHWHSRSSQTTRGASGGMQRLSNRGAKVAPKRQSSIGFTRSVLSGPADYTPPSKLSSSNVSLLKMVGIAAAILLAIIALAFAVL